MEYLAIVLIIFTVVCFSATCYCACKFIQEEIEYRQYVVTPPQRPQNPQAFPNIIVNRPISLNQEKDSDVSSFKSCEHPDSTDNYVTFPRVYSNIECEKDKLQYLYQDVFVKVNISRRNSV
jgi:hypothetical protein